VQQARQAQPLLLAQRQQVRPVQLSIQTPDAARDNNSGTVLFRTLSKRDRGTA
jgi:hypothetical protein